MRPFRRPFEPAASTLTNDKPPAAVAAAKQQLRVERKGGGGGPVPPEFIFAKPATRVWTSGKPCTVRHTGPESRHLAGLRTKSTRGKPGSPRHQCGCAEPGVSKRINRPRLPRYREPRRGWAWSYFIQIPQCGGEPSYEAMPRYSRRKTRRLPGPNGVVHRWSSCPRLSSSCTIKQLKTRCTGRAKGVAALKPTRCRRLAHDTGFLFYRMKGN